MSHASGSDSGLSPVGDNNEKETEPMKKLKTPYEHLIPPLTPEEQEALKADIRKNGILMPLIVDEDDNILDGHHRYKLKRKDQEFPTKVITGLTEQEKIAFVYRTVMTRRNISPEDKEKLREQMMEHAWTMNQSRVKQKDIAQHLGVTQQTVSKWIEAKKKEKTDESKPEIIPNTTSCIRDNGSLSSPPKKKDIRYKLTEEEKQEIIERVENGESQTSVAADYGIKQNQVSRIMKKHREQQQQEQEGGEQEDNQTDETVGELFTDEEPDTLDEEGGEGETEGEAEEEKPKKTPDGNILGSAFKLNDLECTFDGSFHNLQLWDLVGHFILHVRSLVRKDPKRKTIPLGDVEKFAREAKPLIRSMKD